MQTAPQSESADMSDIAARVEALMPMVADSDPRVRKSAAVALGRMASPAAADALARLLADPDEGVRVLACQALGRVAHASSVVVLALRAHDESPEVRAGVLWALANIAAHAELSTEARDALFTPVVVLAFDPDDGVRADAAAVLGALHDPRTTEPLLVLLEDEVPRVRANACASLGLSDDAAGLDALLAVVENTGEDPLVLVSALDGLARRADRGTIQVDAQTADRAVDALLVLAVCGLGGAVEASGPEERDPDLTDVRATAVWSLGHAAPFAPSRRAKVQELLVAALRSGESWTACYAAEALARIHDDDARMALTEAVAASAEQNCPPEVAAVFVQALQTFSPEA